MEGNQHADSPFVCVLPVSSNSLCHCSHVTLKGDGRPHQTDPLKLWKTSLARFLVLEARRLLSDRKHEAISKHIRLVSTNCYYVRLIALIDASHGSVLFPSDKN